MTGVQRSGHGEARGYSWLPFRPGNGVGKKLQPGNGLGEKFRAGHTITMSDGA